VTEIPQEWVQSGAEALEYDTDFPGDDLQHVARTVIEDVLRDIRHAIAEDLRAEARRMREAYRAHNEGLDPGRPTKRPNLDHWANAYEAAALRIEDARYPWRRGSPLRFPGGESDVPANRARTWRRGGSASAQLAAKSDVTS
jgi:hypothetical protein